MVRLLFIFCWHVQYRREEDEQARVMFDRAEAIKLAEMERRKAMASENIARIRMEVAQKVRAAEAEWQVLFKHYQRHKN